MDAATVTIPLPILADYMRNEFSELIETEGIDLTSHENPEELWEQITNTLDLESFGRVAALRSLAESLEANLSALACEQSAEAVRNECLPGMLAALGRSPFTVVGSYVDNGQRFGEVVWAGSAEQAERLAIAYATSDLNVAGVLEGAHRVVR